MYFCVPRVVSLYLIEWCLDYIETRTGIQVNTQVGRRGAASVTRC